MPLSSDRTPFFTLPLELRELVYKAVLSSPSQGPDLLRTCREIHYEAHKFLFERPLSFRGQVAIFEWLSRVPQDYVDRVTEFSLNIQDVDLRSLLTASALVSHPGDPPRLLTWDLYDAELDRLLHALKRLSNVRKITIRAITGRQSFLYREFLQKFLRVLSFLFPDLTDLSLEGNLHHQELSFLSAFSKLQAFSFDGFSASTPSETANILSGLEQLTSLSLVSQSNLLTPVSQTRANFTTSRQFLTGGVINKIDQLKCFSVTEIIPVAAPTLFFTAEVLASLQNHRGLKMFKVCLSQTPSNETLEALGNFLSHAHIHTLEVDWPQLDPCILDTFSLVPDGLEQLGIRATRAADAFEIIKSITDSRDAGDIHAFNELILMRSTQTDDIVADADDRRDSGTGEITNNECTAPSAREVTDTSNVIQARARLQALGVRVSWCTDGL